MTTPSAMSAWKRLVCASHCKAIGISSAPGTVIVRASQTGNDTYAAAADVTLSFAVTPVGPLVFFGTLGAGTLQSNSFAAQITQDGKPAR